jgi:hypothetical protein
MQERSLRGGQPAAVRCDHRVAAPRKYYTPPGYLSQSPSSGGLDDGIVWPRGVAASSSRVRAVPSWWSTWTSPSPDLCDVRPGDPERQSHRRPTAPRTVRRRHVESPERVPIEDLVEAVVIHADHLQVMVDGAPPLNVTLAEVGLRDPGTKPSVSEGDLRLGATPPHPGRVARVVIPGRYHQGDTSQRQHDLALDARRSRSRRRCHPRHWPESLELAIS